MSLALNRLTGALPASLTNLSRLRDLSIESNAGLCAPADDDFQAWLETLDGFRGETCAEEAVPALPAAGLLVAMLLASGIGAGLLRRRGAKA